MAERSAYWRHEARQLKVAKTHSHPLPTLNRPYQLPIYTLQYRLSIPDEAEELCAAASLFPQAEGGDGRLPIALSHLEVTFGVRDDVWIVGFVAPAQSADGKLGAPHVRLQLLQRQRSISTRHFSHLREAS